MSSDDPITELNAAARRAGHMVTEQIDAIIERARQQAETIVRQAERDAEDTRREAVEAAKRLLDRIRALEFPLGELVVSLREEMDHVSGELEGGDHVDSHATALPAAPDSAQAEADPAFSEDWPGETAGEAEQAPFETAAEEQPTDERDPVDAEQPTDERELAVEERATDEREPVGDEQPAGEEEPAAEERPAGEEQPTGDQERAGEDGTAPAPVEEPAGEAIADAGDPGKGNARIRRRAKPKGKGPFITTEGHCAICHRAFRAGSATALAESGWKANGDVGLCPHCQADRWQLPEGARLPVRPGAS